MKTCLFSSNSSFFRALAFRDIFYLTLSGNIFYLTLSGNIFYLTLSGNIFVLLTLTYFSQTGLFYKLKKYFKTKNPLNCFLLKFTKVHGDSVKIESV